MLEKIDADNSSIKKSPDNSSITVTAPQITIVIKLDEKAKKATTTLDMTGNNSKKYDYTILYLGAEILACTLQADKSQVLDSKRLLEAPIYELVREIGRAHDIQQRYINLLAQDTKFMSLVEQSHCEFKKGYDSLMNLRMKS